MTSAPLEYTYCGTQPAWNHKIVLPRILDTLESIPPDGSILDIGCGNGAMLAEIRSRGGWQLHGFETSKSGAEIARSQGFDVGVADDPARLIELFAANSFDLIISVEVVEHVYDPLDLLRRAHSLLRPSGRLLVTTPYHGYLKNLIIALAGKCDSHYNPLWDGGHIKFWSHKTFFAALKRSGFENIRFDGAGRLPYIWKSMIFTAVKAS